MPCFLPNTVHIGSGDHLHETNRRSFSITSYLSLRGLLCLLTRDVWTSKRRASASKEISIVRQQSMKEKQFCINTQMATAADWTMNIIVNSCFAVCWSSVRCVNSLFTQNNFLTRHWLSQRGLSARSLRHDVPRAIKSKVNVCKFRKKIYTHEKSVFSWLRRLRSLDHIIASEIIIQMPLISLCCCSFFE